MMNNAIRIGLCIVQQLTFITSNHESMVKIKKFLSLAGNQRSSIRLTPVLIELCHFKIFGLLQLTRIADLVIGKCSGVILPAWNLYRIRIDSNSYRLQSQYYLTSSLFSPFSFLSLRKLQNPYFLP
jgi:hypothetical protein